MCLIHREESRTARSVLTNTVAHVPCSRDLRSQTLPFSPRRCPGQGWHQDTPALSHELQGRVRGFDALASWFRVQGSGTQGVGRVKSLALEKHGVGRFQAMREQLKQKILVPDSQDRSLASTVLYVPYSLDSGSPGAVPRRART